MQMEIVMKTVVGIACQIEGRVIGCVPKHQRFLRSEYHEGKNEMRYGRDSVGDCAGRR